MPSLILIIYRHLYLEYHKLRNKILLRFFRIRINRKSEICYLLLENWSDYKTDLFPKNRRMAVLKEKNVAGMSAENIRFFVNELVRRYAKNGVYLEVGIFQGCSLLSAALFNPTTRCIGIDNYSQFNPYGDNEYVLRKNLEKFGNPKNIEYFNQDYKAGIGAIFSKNPSLKIDIYYYDGNHDYEDQVEGLQISLPYLASKCVIIVDDVNLESVQKANKYFIRRNPDFKSVFKIVTKGNGSPDWWNGFEVITRGI